MKALTAPLCLCLLAAFGCDLLTVKDTPPPKQEAPKSSLVILTKHIMPAVVMLVVTRQGDAPDKTYNVKGAGVVIEDGIVVTAEHVVATAIKIVVKFTDGTEVAADAVAHFPKHELAFLKVKLPKDLQPVPLCTRLLEVGEDVLAIGDPYGYDWSVTSGIISALDRKVEMEGDTSLTDIIQTSACLNPGNSGGGVFNLEGELIGIVVGVRDRAQGIGFIINVKSVKMTLALLKEKN